MLRNCSLVFGLLVLLGCKANSNIQGTYMVQEDTCRSEAESKVSAASDEGDKKESAVKNADSAKSADSEKSSDKDKKSVTDQEAAKDKKDKTSIAASAFSECMNKGGWKVSVPKAGGAGKVTATVVPVPPAPNTASEIEGATSEGSGGAAGTVPVKLVPPSGNSSAVPAAPILGPGVQPSPASAVEGEPTVNYPTSSLPPAAQPKAPPPRGANMPSLPNIPSNSGPSTYQPARPEGVATPDYGQGAGRNF